MNKFIVEFFRKGWNSPTLMTWGNLLSSSGKLLILTPLILINYNVNEIAFWYLLLTINSFIVVVDFGFYPTFSRIISYVFNGLDHIADVSKISRDSVNKKPSWGFMEKIYGTVNVTYFFLSFIVVFIVLIASYKSIGLIIERTDNFEKLWFAYVTFLLSIVFAFFARRSDIVIVGTNHVALINRWNIINNLANSFSSILIVYFGFGIEWLAVNQLVFSLLLIVRNYYLEIYICNSKFKTFKTFDFNIEIFKWVWAPTWKSGVLILASTGLTQITGIFYSTMSTSAELASYLITLKLVTTISQFSQAPFYSKLPLYSGFRVRNEIDKLTDQTSSAIFKSLMVFVLGIMSLFFFGDYLLRLIGANTELQPPLFIVLMAFVWFFERHHAMHAQIYVTTNKIPFYKTAIVSGIINITLMYLLVPKIGVWGFPVSLALANMVINNWWNVKISLESINQKFWTFFYKSALVPLLILILLSSTRLFLT